MGYTTDFEGGFKITPKLKEKHVIELELFADERHSTEHNNNDSGKFPGLWCQWIPGEEGKTLVWDGGEKFHNYTEWLEYLIKNFFEPKGYKLNGEVKWFGEESEDMGKIVIKDNEVKAKKAKITY